MYAPIRVVVTIIVLLVCLTAPAAAQDVPGVELSAGYSSIHISQETHPVGWYGDASVALGRSIALVGAATGTYYTTTAQFANAGLQFDITGHMRVHTGAGGLRVVIRRTPRVVPFVQVLGGAIRVSGRASATVSGLRSPASSIDVNDSNTNKMIEAGGGIYLMISPRLGARVGGYDMSVFGEGNTTSGFRFSAGLVVGL